MIGASKILTVSYGTFSCTLEGFDDPFNTMRAIAEYFRDLAAEDRYFGAEPPTPDAAMLHRIAEREVQRRVEAKINENGVILRTGDAMSDQPVAAPAPQPPAPQPQVSLPPLAPAPTPMPEGVAAKLMRIRAAVANAETAEAVVAPAAPAPATAAPTPQIIADYIEDEHFDDQTAFPVEDFALPDPLIADIAPPSDPAPIAVAPAATDLTPEVEAFDDLSASDLDADAYESDYTDIDFAALTAAATPDEPEAASLDSPADLDPVEATGAADQPETGDAVFAEAAQDDEIASNDDLADLRALDGAPDELDDALQTEDRAIADAEPLILSTADAYEDESDALESTASEQDADDRVTAAFAEIEETEIESLFAAPAADTAFEAEVESDADTDPEPAEADDIRAPGPSEKARRARARVIKIRRDETGTEAPTTPAVASAKLTAEAEDDLRRELQDLQKDTPATADDDTTDDDTSGPDGDPRKRLDAAGEEAVSRLIEQTNEAMAVPENRRRLSAIAHLKAAVAATVADRFAKGGSARKEPETARLDPYREDLARVVRPQAPAGAEETAPAPRPAPLVLVSAQRIDRPRTSAPADGGATLTSVPNTPIRPRRVTTAMLAVETLTDVDDDDEDESDSSNIFTDTRGFAEFSERLGADGLAEILEAAAAYAVCIEGRPYFSRPQLMSQINALSESGDYTREEGLRTFGMLLRQGRIQKIKRGQFVLTEQSPFLAKARSIAG